MKGEHKHRLESNIIYMSLATQALLTFAVVGFAGWQLNRCPVGDSDTNDATGAYDTASCPRALYTNMITAAVAYWFPAPWMSLVQVANNSVPTTDERSPTGRSTDRKPRPKGRDSEPPLDK